MKNSPVLGLFHLKQLCAEYATLYKLPYIIGIIIKPVKGFAVLCTY